MMKIMMIMMTKTMKICDMSMLRHMVIVAFACLCCCVGIRGFVAIKSGFCEIVALGGVKKWARQARSN